jgi:hypothetical protein
MTHLVEVPVGDTTVIMEVTQLDRGLVPAGRGGRALAQATRSLDEVLEGVKEVAASCVRRFADMETAPSEISVELGITLSADADIVIASTSTEAAITVSLTWNNER